METHRRGSDGRRLFNAEFKREQLARVQRKELTVAELSRELGIHVSLVRRWQSLMDRGGKTAVTANEEAGPLCEVRPAHGRIRQTDGSLAEKRIERASLKAHRARSDQKPPWQRVAAA